MKTFKSAAALKKAALSKGASASLAGVRFNSTADKVVGLEKPKPQEEECALSAQMPEPPPPEPIKYQEPAVDLACIVQPAVDAMACSVAEIAKDSARVMEEVAKAVERITLQTAVTTPEPAPEAPAKAWKLKINRDLRGFMDTVDITRVG